MQVHGLHSTSVAATLLVVLHCANYALAQSAPVSSDRPWHSSADRNIEADLRDIPDSRFTIDSAKTHSLPELIDIAEAHNPATRDSWERARAQAAALGVARSELFPVLGAVAVSEDRPAGDIIRRSVQRPGSPDVSRWNWTSITPSLTSGPARVESTLQRRSF